MIWLLPSWKYVTANWCSKCEISRIVSIQNLKTTITAKPELSADFIEGSPSKETVSNAVDYREIKKLKDEVGHIAHWKGFSGKVYQIGKLQLIESDKMISD